MKILVATEKPFSKQAVAGIKEIAEKNGHELVVLEKYKEKQELLEAVESVNAIIISLVTHSNFCLLINNYIIIPKDKSIRICD